MGNAVAATVTTMTACLHCGAATSAGERYCCAGCEAVAEALAAGGLQRWYTLRDRDPDAASIPAAPVVDSDFAYLDLLASRGGGQSAPLQLALHGMTCAACAWLVESLAARCDDISGARVQLADSAVSLTVSPGGRLSRFAREIGAFGYSLAPLSADTARESSRKALANVALAGALAANAMLMAVPSYAGLADGWMAALFGWVGALLGTVALLGPGRSLLLRAFAAARRRIVTLDVPLASGLVAAWALSCWRLLAGDFEGLYFDSLAALVFTITGGRWLRDHAVQRALRGADVLAARLPLRVAIWRGDHYVLSAPEEVVAGDLVRVPAGATLPCEGVATAPCDVDLAVVTGELAPRAVQRGERVPAGARALGAALHACAVGPAERDLRPPAVTAAPSIGALDGFAPWFSAAVLVAAALAAVAWWPSGAEVAVRNAMTVLLVACPCAIALAGPLVHARAMAAGGASGLLLRDAGALLRLRDVQHALLDKTGTLTTGAPAVTSERWWVQGAPRSTFSAAAAAIQSTSPHPLAKALAGHLRVGASATNGDVEPATADAAEGGGIRGGWDGVQLLMTGREGLWKHNVALDEEQLAAIDAVQSRGATLVALVEAAAQPPRLLAVLGLEDALRDGVQEAVGALTSQGIAPQLLSGDHEQAVARVSAAANVPIAGAAVSPEDKAAVVRRLDPDRCLVFGDGRNDVPALQQAAVSVSLAGTDPLAIEQADVIVTNADLSAFSRLVELGSSARRTLRASLAWGLVYNVAGVCLAVAGLITPLLAAVLMPVSSLTILVITRFGIPALEVSGSLGPSRHRGPARSRRTTSAT